MRSFVESPLVYLLYAVVGAIIGTVWYKEGYALWTGLVLCLEFVAVCEILIYLWSKSWKL
jgi:hypothetical protein